MARRLSRSFAIRTACHDRAGRNRRRAPDTVVWLGATRLRKGRGATRRRQRGPTRPFCLSASCRWRAARRHADTFSRRSFRHAGARHRARAPSTGEGTDRDAPAARAKSSLKAAASIPRSALHDALVFDLSRLRLAVDDAWLFGTRGSAAASVRWVVVEPRTHLHRVRFVLRAPSHFILVFCPLLYAGAFALVD